MGVAVEGHEQGELTLVFTLSALDTFEDPAAVVADASEWSRYVGIVGRHAPKVESYAEAHGIESDFDLGDDDKWQTMERLRTTTSTPRHVFVGVTDGDRTLAGHLDWEFLTVPEAAEKAGWELERDTATPGLLGRLRSRVSSLLPGEN